jgi:predicted permease
MDTFRSLLNDLGTGARTLSKRPFYSGLCIVILATGVGTSVAMFAVVQAVLIRPLPVQAQDRLLFVTKHPRNDRQVLPFSYEEQAALSRLPGIVVASGGVQYDAPLPITLTAGREAFNVDMAAVTPNFFDVLGARAELGSLSVPSRGEESSEIVISRRLWQSRFGGDSGVIGRSIRFGQTWLATIVGVAPAGLEFPHGTDAWYLLRPPAGREAQFSMFSGLVRLTTGTSLERVRSAAQVIVSRDTTGGVMVAEAVPLLEATIGNVRGSVLILSVAAGLVFLVAIANAASLVLVHGSSRARELAVRSALGASRPRIVRLLTVEAGLLAAVSAGLGIALTFAVLRALVALTPAEVARVTDVDASPALLAAAALAAFVAVLFFGVLPAIWLSRHPPFGALRSAQAGADALGGSGRIREILVCVQVALAVLVAAGAGLMARTLHNLNRLDLGVDRAALTIVKLTPGGGLTVPAMQRFFDRLADRVAESPEIDGATPLTSQPFEGWRGWTTRFARADQDSAAAALNPYADLEMVGPGFFRTMGIDLLRGRSFDHTDRAGQPDRAIVNEALANLAWPGQDPIGKRLLVRGTNAEVVALVRSTRFRDLITPAPTVYMSYAQQDTIQPIFPRFLAVRSGLSPERVAALVSNEARQLAPNAIAYETISMDQAMAGQLARPRFSASLFMAFASVTLLLVGAGLYATVSALVQQRARDIGIRIALGARPIELGRFIMRRGLRIIGVGLAVGLAASVLGTRVIRNLLFGVAPADPVVLLLTAAVITTIALVACLVPTARATRIDPMLSLRAD